MRFSRQKGRKCSHVPCQFVDVESKVFVGYKPTIGSW